MTSNRMRGRAEVFAVVVASLAVLAPGVAVAQDAGAPADPDRANAAQPTALREAISELLGAEEVVVTARETPVVPQSWAGGRTILGPEELRTAGQATLLDVIQRVPGVYVEEEAGNDTKPNLGMRGVKSERTTETTVLVDGIPLSPAPYGHPGLSLFPFTMERAWAVDVIRSGYATRYGPNNVVGVINFLTPPIPATPMASERIRFAGDDYRSFYTVAGGTWGDFGVIVEDVRKSGDTYRDNGSFSVRSRGFKASWRTSDTSRLLFQYDVYRDESRLAGGLSDADYEKDPHQTKQPRDFFEGDQQRGNVRWVFEPDADTRLELLAYAYGSFRTFWLGSPTQYGSAPTRFQATPRRMTTAAFAPTFTRRFDVTNDVENTIALGGRLQRELIHTATDRRTVSTGVVERTADQVHEYAALSLWAEDTVRIFDRLSVTGGVRSEAIDIDAFDRLTQTQAQDDVSKVLPAVSAAFDVTPELSVFWSSHQGFRPPAYSQVAPAATYEPLGLETSKSWDAGARARFLDGGLDAEVTRFHVGFENRYITDPADPDHFINAGEQRHDGWEIAAGSDLGRLDAAMTGFHAYVSGTFLDTEQLTGSDAGKELSDAPRRRYAWGVGYRHETGVRFGIDGMYVGKSFGDPTNTEIPDATGATGINPSRAVWSARVGYDTAVDAEGRWNVGVEFGMTNMFDAEGFNRFGSRGIVPIAPRSAFVGLSISANF